MPALIIRTAGGGEEQYTFTERLVMGRQPGSGLTLKDPKVSRQHAAVEPYGSGWRLIDLASSNGTFVDDLRIYDSVALVDGDKFRVGSTSITFTADERREQAVSLRSAEFNVMQEIDANDGGLKSAMEGSGSVAVDRMKRHLQMMYDIATASSETLDEDRLLDLAVAKLFEYFPQSEHVLVLFVKDDGEFLIARSCDRNGQADAVISRTVAKQVIETRRGLLSMDVSKDARIEDSKSISAMLFRSVACIPIISRQEVLGLVQLSGSESRPPFSAEDLPLLVGVASQIGAAVANARLHRSAVAQEMVKQDLGLARRIQARFLPAGVPDIGGYEFGCEYSAALEVGGDYYDFVPLPNGRLGIVVGDVSGKGISAALYMARLSSEMRYQAAAPGAAAEIVTRLNAAMSRELEEGMFITMLYMVLDPETRSLEIVNCGHPEPLVRKADGTVTSVAVTRQVPIGVLDSFQYQSAMLQLERGDTIVMFTDGVSEAMDADSNPFGTDRLVNAMQNAAGAPPWVCASIVHALDEHVGSVAQHDDVTLVCFGPV